jgi:membrane-associated phospholipid phosphatase
MKGSKKPLFPFLSPPPLKEITLGLLSLICLLTFHKIRKAVLIHQDTAFDARLFAWITQITSPGLTLFMRKVTFFGSSEYFMVAPLVLVFLFSFYRGMRWHALRVLVITGSTVLLHQLLKHNFKRIRPPEGLQEYTGFGFPSGHAMISAAFYGVLIYLVWGTGLTRGWRWVLTCLLTAFTLLIGFSRIYLKVHYPTDVLAGLAVGVFWLLLSIYLLDKAETLYRHLKSGNTQAPKQSKQER